MKGTCLITGASSGIGAALARKFADQEFNLIISGRDQTSLNEVRQTFANPDNAQIVTADLSKPEGASHLITEVEKLRLPVDILVNNAGIILRGNLNDHSIADIENLLHVNTQSLTRLTHHFLPGMITRDCGRILNVASVAAFQPIPGMDIYAASKAYVLSLSESLSEQLRGTGVSVTVLCPGVTRTRSTEQLADVLPSLLVSSPEEVAEEGFEALMARETIRIPGAPNKTAVMLSQLQPRTITRRIGGIISRLAPGVGINR